MSDPANPVKSTPVNHLSHLVLDVVENFLETHPELEGKDIEFLPRDQGVVPSNIMLRMKIDGVKYLVQCTQGGWSED